MVENYFTKTKLCLTYLQITSGDIESQYNKAVILPGWNQSHPACLSGCIPENGPGINQKPFYYSAFSEPV